MLKVTQGFLVEYSLALPPLVLAFEFNPTTITRNKKINLKAGNAPGTQGGYGFTSPTETPHVSQGTTMQPETFSINVLFDATDRMNDNDVIAKTHGIEPELDTLRTMTAPKSQTPEGMRLLSSLGLDEQRAFNRDKSASVLLFIWGSHVLPVFMTEINVVEKAHKPNLVPYRAEVTLSMQVIESQNPFYQVETVRQVLGAGLNSLATVPTIIGGLI